MMKIVAYFLASMCFATLPAFAKTPSVLGPAPGYSCMILNLTQKQLMDPTIQVVVHSKPSKNSSPEGDAGGIVIVPTPIVKSGSYTKAIGPFGNFGWIKSSLLLPYHSLSDPKATCSAVHLSNGRIGFSTKN